MNELLEHQFLTFTLKGELYAIPVARVREVLVCDRITKLPRTESYLKGLIDLRGQGVPVLDLSLRLGMEETQITKNTAIIVVDQGSDEAGSSLAGLLADSVHEVVMMGEEAMERAPALGIGSAGAFLRNVGKIDGRFALILDLGKVFDEREITLPGEPEKAIA